jgi:hypothetical protein
MPYLVPKNIQAPKSEPLKYWQSNLLNGGANYVDREWKLPDNQTPKLLNMWWKEGEPSKRWGQEYVEDSITVETPCYATYEYLYNGYIVKHCGTKLYKHNPTTETTTEILTGLTAKKGKFTKFNGKLYYRQTGKYIEINTSLVASLVVPYIPTVIINRTPTGGGDVLENYNRIGKGFTNKFNGTGAAVAYTLTDAMLDATTVTCTVGGVSKVETTDFTVDRTTGIVTFTVAPGVGTNNVVLTAYKTVQDDIDSILDCMYDMPFGGQNDNRLFIGGNGTGYFYWTGISANGIDATYFAYNNYNIIGNPDENITGFKIHYETLCIFKDKQISGETYDWDGIKGIFSTFTINPNIGCDCPDTLQNIKNDIVWLTSYSGPQILISSDRTNKRNVQPLGRNINPRLLKETNLKTASSVDFNGHYLLCVNDKVYLWNYFITPYIDTGNPDESAKILSWWYWDNVNAGSFIADESLYYADRTTGGIAKFKTGFNDFGSAIESMYRVPLRDFGNTVYEFDVLTMWVDIRVDTRTKIDIAYIMADETDLESESALVEAGSFYIPGFSIPTFTLDVIGSRQTFTFEPQEKKIDLFGVEFSNSEVNRDMNISNVVFSYKLGKRKR